MKNKKNRCYKDENSDIKKEEIMRKRILTIFLAVAGITIIGLGAINEAKALSVDVKEDCTNFNVELTDVTANVDGSYTFTYLPSSGTINLSSISYMSLGIDRHFVLGPGDDPVVGAGNLDGWLEGVPMKTYALTPQVLNNAQPFSIEVSGISEDVANAIKYYGKDSIKGEIFLVSKAGRQLESCVIDGPVMPPPLPDLPIDVTVPQTKQVSLLRGSNVTDYCIDIDIRTGCPFPDAVPYVCGDPEDSLDIDGNFKVGSGTGEDEGPDLLTMAHGAGQDPRCPVVKLSHNPCQWIILTGKAYGPVCW